MPYAPKWEQEEKERERGVANNYIIYPVKLKLVKATCGY
jgi:hypothetical protein